MNVLFRNTEQGGNLSWQAGRMSRLRIFKKFAAQFFGFERLSAIFGEFHAIYRARDSISPSSIIRSFGAMISEYSHAVFLSRPR